MELLKIATTWCLVGFVSFVISQRPNQRLTHQFASGGVAIVTSRDVNGVYVPILFEVTYPPTQQALPRQSFGSTRPIQARMQEMNARPKDEKGHIVASQNGGPAQPWNLFPQTANFNRNKGNRPILSDWYSIEGDIAQFRRSGGSVRQTVSFTYGNRTEPRRPSRLSATILYLPAGGGRTNTVETHFNNEDSPILGIPRATTTRPPGGRRGGPSRGRTPGSSRGTGRFNPIGG